MRSSSSSPICEWCSRCSSGEHADAEGLTGDVLADGVTIANEFTAVHVRPVQTRNGERLEIRSLRLPYAIRLDALLLEALTWQDPLELGTALEVPFGPEGAAATAPDDAPPAAPLLREPPNGATNGHRKPADGS